MKHLEGLSHYAALQVLDGLRDQYIKSMNGTGLKYVMNDFILLMNKRRIELSHL